MTMTTPSTTSLEHKICVNFTFDTTTWRKLSALMPEDVIINVLKVGGLDRLTKAITMLNKELTDD